MGLALCLLSAALQEELQPRNHLYRSFNADKSDSVSHGRYIVQILHSALIQNIVFVHKTFFPKFSVESCCAFAFTALCPEHQ